MLNKDKCIVDLFSKLFSIQLKINSSTKNAFFNLYRYFHSYKKKFY